MSPPLVILMVIPSLPVGGAMPWLLARSNPPAATTLAFPPAPAASSSAAFKPC